MAAVRIYCETWAVSFDRIYSFFKNCPDICPMGETGDILCSYDNKVEVRLTSLDSRFLGPIAVPQTRVEIRGSDCEAEKLHRDFTMQFLSAGG